MKKIQFTLILLLSITLFNCDNDDDATNNVCDENYVNAALSGIFTIVNGYDAPAEWMDLETHEYTLVINASGEICSVGYQNPSTYTGSYTMEITNISTGATYSGVHTFSQSSLDYQNITAITVNSGDYVKIKRTITAGYTALNQTLGRAIRKSDYSDIPYPLTLGNIEFISSAFYGAGGPIYNFVQPYIALGFKVN